VKLMNEEVMLDYPRSLDKDRSCAPYVIKMIVSQVESMNELCIFKYFIDLSLCYACFASCNDCNDFVGCSHNFI
jgi:hypothetical protein